MKKIFLGLLVFLIPTHCFCEGFGAIDFGYRYDRINILEELFDRNNPMFGISIENMYHNVQNFRLGGRAKWLGICTCPVLIKGGGHYSWVCSGSFTADQVSRGRLEGHAADATVALGYLFPLCGIEIAPFVGFGWDEILYKIKGVKSAFNMDMNVFLEGTKWHGCWYAPWIGFDGYFGSCFCSQPFAFEAGYEFHYGWANLRFKPRQNSMDFVIFESRTHLSNMIGHVFRVGFETPVWRCLVAGLDLQYTFWHNMHRAQDKIPGSSETGLPPGGFQKTVLANWRSFCLTFNLGLDF